MVYVLRHGRLQNCRRNPAGAQRDTYFMRPELPYETTGQINQVVFLGVGTSRPLRHRILGHL